MGLVPESLPEDEAGRIESLWIGAIFPAAACEADGDFDLLTAGRTTAYPVVPMPKAPKAAVDPVGSSYFVGRTPRNIAKNDAIAAT